MASKPNVKVKVDDRGRMQVFVDGQRMAGVTNVTYGIRPRECGVLTIEVIGLMVDFEQLPKSEKEELVAAE